MDYKMLVRNFHKTIRENLVGWNAHIKIEKVNEVNYENKSLDGSEETKIDVEVAKIVVELDRKKDISHLFIGEDAVNMYESVVFKCDISEIEYGNVEIVKSNGFKKNIWLNLIDKIMCSLVEKISNDMNIE